MSVFVPNPQDSVSSSAHSVLLVFLFLSCTVSVYRLSEPSDSFLNSEPRSGNGAEQNQPRVKEALNLTAQLREVLWCLCDTKLALSWKDNCMGQIPSGYDDAADWYPQGSLSSWGCTSLSIHDLRCTNQDGSHWSREHDIPCTQQTELHTQSVGMYIIYTCAYT